VNFCMCGWNEGCEFKDGGICEIFEAPCETADPGTCGVRQAVAVLLIVAAICVAVAFSGRPSEPGATTPPPSGTAPATSTPAPSETTSTAPAPEIVLAGYTSSPASSAELDVVYLDDVEVTLRNEGDAPAKVYELTLAVGDEEYTSVPEEILGPREEADFTIPCRGSIGREIGVYSFTGKLVVLDSARRTLLERDLTFTVPTLEMGDTLPGVAPYVGENFSFTPIPRTGEASAPLSLLGTAFSASAGALSQLGRRSYRSRPSCGDQFPYFAEHGGSAEGQVLYFRLHSSQGGSKIFWGSIATPAPLIHGPT